MPRRIFQKSVAEVMNEYAPVYPESGVWADTVSLLLSHDADIITELQKQYLEQGKFREPIVLKFSDSDEDMKDQTNDRLGYVADGTHRLVSAYLLKVDNILVSDSHEESEEKDYSIVTRISNTNCRAFSDDESDIFFEKLRSICISESLWITSSIASGSTDNLSIYWDEYDLSLLQTINDAVDLRLEEIFPEISFAVETLHEPWDL